MDPILIEGDPRLRRMASPLESLANLGTSFDRCAATLAAFRRQHGFGRGLAAVQIGIPLRLIAVDLGAGPFAVINPQIIFRSDETFELWDDCFSVPDKLVRVRRNRCISLEYRDQQFRLRRWERLPPELSELLQHEIDHLDGVLMTDRALPGASLRPANERGKLIDAGRISRRLSLARIREAAQTIDPAFLHSPQFILSEELGCSLTLKVETDNPVGSFKGRGADFYLSKREAGRELVCASAGNFGLALAYACSKRKVPLTVFAARTASAFKVERIRALGADVRLAGEDFDAAKIAAREFAIGSGALWVEDGAAAEISEGAGSIAVELLESGAAFDDLLVPLGGGALLNGIARWVKAASPATRVIGVQARGAPAMAESFRAGRSIAHASVQTIADGIAVRVPIPEALEDMRAVVDDVLLVDDASLLKAMKLLHRHAGLVVEPSGAAGVAALLESPAPFAGRNVATVITGGNIKETQS